MKYTKHHFSSGMKINLADVLNRMEDGIAAACGAAVEGIGSVTTGDTPAADIRDGKLCLTLPRGDPGPQGDPGEGLSDNAKALLLSLLADTAPGKAAALAHQRTAHARRIIDPLTLRAADQLYKSLAVACGDRKYFSSTLGSKMSISDKVDAFPVLRNAVEA